MSAAVTELVITKHLLNQRNYQKLGKTLTKYEIDTEFKTLWSLIDSYYQKYPDIEQLSVSELRAYFDYNYPKLKNREVYHSLLDRVSELDVSDQLEGELVVSFHEKHIANQIIQKLLPVVSDSEFGVVPAIQADIDRFKQIAGLEMDPAKHFVGHDLDELVRLDTTPGLEWRLKGLNDDIGPLRGNTLGHVFASVDTGKTAFIISEAAWMVQQLQDDERILWFNNEEDGRRTLLRVYCALLDMSKSEVITNIKQAQQMFIERGGDKILIIDRPIISIDDIRLYLKEMHSRLTIVDQGDKVSFRGQDKTTNSAERLKILYGRFRELGKEFGTNVLTVGQATADAEGQKWLNRTHMDNSKVGKPGELDYAIGIGKSNKDTEQDYRFISICKNKLGDGNHGKHTVRIDTSKHLYYNF